MRRRARRSSRCSRVIGSVVEEGDNDLMPEHRERSFDDDPGPDLGRFVPDDQPVAWPHSANAGLVVWVFLDSVTDQPVRPWLVVEEDEPASLLGSTRFAV